MAGFSWINTEPGLFSVFYTTHSADRTLHQLNDSEKWTPALKQSRDPLAGECIAHDAFRFSLALDLAQDKGEDFAVMVMEAKGWGRIDLTQAKAWVASNGHYCRCEGCRPGPRRPLAAPAQQLSLF